MIYIVRHGETEKNKKKTLQGRSNFPLNEEGRNQAKRLHDFFQSEGVSFDEVYASPLIRAVETAQLAAGFNSNEIVTDDRILEMDYGPYEGISLENPPMEIITFFSDFVNNPAPEGMEPLDSVTNRMGEFVETLAKKKDKNILIAAHAISMKGALEYLSPESNGKYWSTTIANCEVYAFECTENGFSVPQVYHCGEARVDGR